MSENNQDIKEISLNEYLSSLVASVNYSRMNADLESLKIAKIYSEDEYMKDFSIPRMKIKDVVMDIPVAIEGFKMKEGKTSNKNTIDNYAVMSAVYSDLKKFYEVDHFPENLSYKIRKTVFEKIDEMENRINLGEKKESIVESFSSDLSKTINKEIKKDDTGKQIEKQKIEKVYIRKIDNAKKIDFLELKELSKEKNLLKSKSLNSTDKNTSKNEEDKMSTENIEEYLNEFLKDSLLQNFLLEKRDGKIGYVSVVSESHRIKELPIDSLVKIKMTIEEESIEWSTSEGTNKKRLLPE
jgi:hypothetical protein